MAVASGCRNCRFNPGVHRLLLRLYSASCPDGARTKRMFLLHSCWGRCSAHAGERVTASKKAICSLPAVEAKASSVEFEISNQRDPRVCRIGVADREFLTQPHPCLYIRTHLHLKLTCKHNLARAAHLRLVPKGHDRLDRRLRRLGEHAVLDDVQP